MGEPCFMNSDLKKNSEQVPFTLSIINKQRNNEVGSLSEIRHYKVNVDIIKKGFKMGFTFVD